MKAIVCHKLGDPTREPSSSSALRLEEAWPSPFSGSSLPPTFVRIRVVASSLNFADALTVMGKYQERPQLPFIPGAEVSGIITELGADVKQLYVGLPVCAVVSTGGYAEEVACDSKAVFPLPAGTDIEAAAGLPVAFGTAHLALAHRARLQPGQVLLVLGAAGGVGAAAVQVGKLMGAVVIAVCKGPEKGALLWSMGVDHVIDSEAASGPGGGVRDGVRAFLKARGLRKGGVDVVFDPVGGAQLEEAIRTVDWGAQILVIGFASGKIPTVAFNIALVKNLSIHGVFWGSYLKNEPATLQQSMANLVQWHAQGRIRVHISIRVPLEQIHTAFGALLSRSVLGKAIIVVSSSKEGVRSRL